ncbi:hypothetical protein FE633_14425 [Streptomyces montanus]|uniref:Uncharacterized protein n=1 Tax=Streptomyces montanus TaxID=2580423 RepID=A0A5R9FW61_9ACTN|nr:hypothetical protein FE633_14425 [Streptomyces montanus]
MRTRRCDESRTAASGPEPWFSPPPRSWGLRPQTPVSALRPRPQTPDGLIDAGRATKIQPLRRWRSGVWGGAPGDGNG